MSQKYKLREDLTKEHNGITLYRVEALKDFGKVKKGELGGYVEKEDNLSQSGTCWVYDDAQVYGSAEVRDNAKVSGSAEVSGNTKVYGNARVRGHAEVCDNAIVYGHAEVCYNAKVSGHAEVYDSARVYDNTRVYGYARVYDHARVYGYARVYGHARVLGNAEIYGNAVISNTRDYYVGKNTWSSGRYFTYTRSNKMWRVGCFYGTGEELIEKAYKDSEVSGREYKRVVEYVEAMYKDLENGE